MDCTGYRQSIHELVDGTLGPIRRAELDQHLARCEACRALAADLQYVRDTAGSLDTLTPPARVWLQLAGRLHQEGRLAAPAPAPASRRHAALLALAAALLLAVSASLVVLLRDGAVIPDAVPAQAGNAAAEDPVQAIADELQVVEQHLESMIVRLEAMAKDDPGSQGVDPQALASLQKGRSVLDLAIAESRAAVRAEPDNQVARDSLFDALRRKVALLQDTVVLMNEMRRGNAAGAAQVMDGLNKS